MSAEPLSEDEEAGLRRMIAEANGPHDGSWMARLFATLDATRDEIPVAYKAGRDATRMTLDRAWGAAEAVLPEGWAISVTTYPPEGWAANATAWNFHGGVSAGSERSDGQTAAEALSNLTARLQEQPR